MKHLIREQRYTISQMQRNKVSQKIIAEHVGVSQATISKELSRNRNSKGQYNYQDAQMFADMNKERFVFTQEMEMFIREKLTKYQWSPEQIKGYADSNNIKMVSTERIYQYIRKDRKMGGVLYKNYRHKLKNRKRTICKAGCHHIPNRVKDLFR